MRAVHNVGATTGTRQDLKRILVIRPGHFIGDTVILTPVLDALRMGCPQAHIAIVVDAPGAELLENHRSLDEIIVYRRANRYHARLRRSTLAEHWKTLRRVRTGRFDACIVLHAAERAAFLARFSGAPVRAGFMRPCYGESVYRKFYNILIPWCGEGERRNQSDHLLDAVRALGISASKPQLSLTVDEEAAQSIVPLVRPLLRPLIALNTGDGARAKSWTLEGWRKLTERLTLDYGATVAFVGSGDEQGFVERIITGVSGSVHSLAGRLTLKQTVAFLAQADVFIGIDSGPLHIAAAVGCATVMLSGPTDAARWNPLGARHLVVRAWDYPCPGAGCGAQTPASCMKAISAESVLTAVEELMDRADYSDADGRAELRDSAGAGL